MNTRLEAKVKAVNATNTYGIELYKQLAPIFAPLVGQKIINSDGTLAKKYKKLLPELPNRHDLRTWKHPSDYSLAWGVSANASHEQGSLYHETTVYIGKLENGVLVAIESPFEARTDYDVETVKLYREQYKQIKKIADEAQSRLFPFGEYDR